MSTPIETNTEQLQEVLQQVYNLPSRSGGSTTPDLVIGLNANAETDSNYFVYENVSPEDFLILSGDLASVVEKVKQGIAPWVLLKEMQFYNGSSFSKGIAEATHVSIIGDYESDYSEESVYGQVFITFHVHYLPSYGGNPGYEISLRLNSSTGVVEIANIYRHTPTLING